MRKPICRPAKTAPAFLILLCASFFGSAVFAQRVQVKNVAVIETQIDERSGAASEISGAEVGVITNEIRREAVNNLPRGRFNVMTSETVQAMGDAVLEECAEENCVIALGSKIGADYIVRGIISKFRNNFTLTIEMYETEYGMLVATADAVRTGNLDELLEKTTSVCAEMYRKFVENSIAASAARSPVAPSEPKPESPPAVFTVAANAKPSNGGSVTRSPNQKSYTAGTSVTLTAVPKGGYKFDGWTGAGGYVSNDSVLTSQINGNLSLTANFSKFKAVKDETASENLQITGEPSEKKKTSGAVITMRWGSAAIGAGGIIGGLICGQMAKDEWEKYDKSNDRQEILDKRKSSENLALTGNVLYVLGGVGLSAFTLTLFF